MQILKVLQCKKIKESKIHKNLIKANIKKNIAFSYGCKLVFVDDKFSKPFEAYLGKDAVYNFINSMMEESKYCSEVIKKTPTKCRISDNDYFCKR